MACLESLKFDAEGFKSDQVLGVSVFSVPVPDSAELSPKEDLATVLRLTAGISMRHLPCVCLPNRDTLVFRMAVLVTHPEALVKPMAQSEAVFPVYSHLE